MREPLSDSPGGSESAGLGGESENELDAAPSARRRRRGAADQDSRAYRKRRTVLACDVCRSRRTKCDGERPACSFCRASGADCNYRTIREPPPSKLETEISTIRERLDHIEELLAGRPASPSTPTDAHAQRTQSSPAADSHSGREVDIPVMVIKDVGFIKMLGIDADTADHLVSAERGRDPRDRNAAHGGRMLVLQQHRALEALDVFYDKVHIWFPILHPRFREQYLCAINGALPMSAESCLVLIVAATGFLPDVGSLHNSPRPDIGYANAALEMLPLVLVECSITAVQCLVAIALYYCCSVSPLQAYDYVLIASSKIQTLLKTSRRYADSPEETGLVLRAYWAILILEQELSNQVDLPSSRLWDLDDTTPLPPSHSPSWAHPAAPSPVHSHPLNPLQSPATRTEEMHSATTPYNSSPAVDHGSSNYANSLLCVGSSEDSAAAPTDNNSSPSLEEIEFFFLAEISMRRMLHRCTSSTRLHPTRRVPVYAPLVAAELVYQLEKWHCHLPACLRFDLEEEHDEHHHAEEAGVPGGGGALSRLAELLKTQYYSCKVSIYWPAAYQAIQGGEAGGGGDLVLPAVGLFFRSYVRYMLSVSASARHCRPNAWILYVSVFVLTLAASRAASAPCLEAAAPDEIDSCFSLALQVFDGVAGASPSLDHLGRILEGQLQGGGRE
ncbi:hypothetical protein CONLIGDRAFT_676429 [Coniochaeta ligniaria NRRL 30616]|uniref:Zn(2)-C6 fungal-type domain-containing protein n=1 Tax=Coniochaeta ligniaria NRRL 30616 TaxID=1408157 RepID=A0A1J7J7U8_9PEZI|nr:hypothetical protein CONLIGDRAFT_676429 [Coniochaeta ligniaria NRRL 30616]